MDLLHGFRFPKEMRVHELRGGLTRAQTLRITQIKTELTGIDDNLQSQSSTGNTLSRDSIYGKIEEAKEFIRTLDESDKHNVNVELMILIL